MCLQPLSLNVCDFRERTNLYSFQISKILCLKIINSCQMCFLSLWLFVFSSSIFILTSHFWKTKWWRSGVRLCPLTTNKCWFLWHVVTTVSPLLYGLWLSLISFDFSLIFMMCCSVATIFIQPALPSPFALLPFLPHTGELGLKTIKILERKFLHYLQNHFHRYRSQTNIQD